MADGERAPVRARWAAFRLEVIGTLLADPPAPGQLRQRLQEIAARAWKHPTTGAPIGISFATAERWLYAARSERGDPYNNLARRTRKDAGLHPSVGRDLGEAISEQYRDHPTWNYTLHRDNLVALARENPELGRVPSSTTVTRWMKDHGLLKQKRKKKHKSIAGLERREMRSWEVQYVNQLWHADFHEGSRAVLLPDGSYVHPWMLCILDDHSRLGCHGQWYLVENTENLVHGFCQAAQKRELCAAFLTDGGGAEKAAELQQGLMRLGIPHDITLPNTPEQNGKQESFWNQIEQRLLPMLEGVPNLTLRLLNEATQAWLEQEYNRSKHSETGQPPMDRFLSDRRIGRACPDSAVLRDVFRIQETRAQRRSDGTVSVGSVRYELPSRYRALQRVTVRYARWDPTSIDLVDPRTEQILCTCHPLDRNRNADRARRQLQPVADPAVAIVSQPPRKSGIAPLLRQLMRDYAATGLPPAYLPKDECLPAGQEEST
jgi:transposase InsO family protein